ncbi:MAG: hypothetical protein KGL39_36075 [Patescibacteria group bacterium]|nr:hypothetical protein [Patescibacteria group bacterium]
MSALLERRFGRIGLHRGPNGSVFTDEFGFDFVDVFETKEKYESLIQEIRRMICEKYSLSLSDSNVVSMMDPRSLQIKYRVVCHPCGAGPKTEAEAFQFYNSKALAPEDDFIEV